MSVVPERLASRVAALLPGRARTVLSRGTVRRISVVTVCLNTRDTIRLTLESVARQTFADVEHVVIDGGSKDGTQDIVREYRMGHFVSEKDEGIYHAMDKGARAATGDLLIFLNAGDTFYDDRVCEDVARFAEESGADIVFGNLLPVYLNPGDRHDHGAFAAGQLLDLGYMRNRRQLRDESLHHQATFFRRWIFDRCTYICPRREASGEYNLILDAVFRHGARVKHIPRPVARFVLGGTSTRDFAVEWKKFNTARDILREMYLGDTARLAAASESEFVHHPATPLFSRHALPAPSRAQVKQAIKRSPAFRVYERLALGVTTRAVNQLAPLIGAVEAGQGGMAERLRALEALQARVVDRLAAMDAWQASVLTRLDQLGTLDATHGKVPGRLDALERLQVGQAQGQARLEAAIFALRGEMQAELARMRDLGIETQVNLAGLHGRIGSDAGFEASGYKVFSQWDEDGLIQYLVTHAPIADRSFVEIGIGDYSEANTRLLLQKDNWSGTVIECNGEDVRRLRDSALYWKYSLNAVEAFATRENINDLLRDAGVPRDLGLLSIDVDGVDYWLWQAVEAVSPRILICEYNGIFGSTAKVTVPYDPAFDRREKHFSWLYAGASLAALQYLGRQKGYTLVGTGKGGNNAFFVRDDVLAESSIRPAARLYTRPMFRESRNPDGSLSYLDIAEAVRLIADLDLQDVETGATLRVGDIPLTY